MKILWIGLVLFSSVAFADVNLRPRMEWIQGRVPVSQKTLVKGSLDGYWEIGALKQWKYFLEAYAEKDFASTEMKYFRRAVDRVDVQEAYVETQFGNFYLKLGKQAMRWSESWIVPSLDIWTARKFERLFLDPLSEQLNHSTGMSLSYVAGETTLDFAYMDPAEDTYPQTSGLEERMSTEKDSINMGARIKQETTNNSTWGAVFGRRLRKFTGGAFYSKSFEDFVLKGEGGLTNYDWKNAQVRTSQFVFISAGVDMFFGDHVITPQITHFEQENPFSGKSGYDTLGYLSWTYDQGNHRVFVQGFSNFEDRDAFVGAEYGYDLSENFEIVGLVQNFEGDVGKLSRLYRDYVGYTLYGLRINGFWTF